MTLLSVIILGLIALLISVYIFIIAESFYRHFLLNPIAGTITLVAAIIISTVGVLALCKYFA